MKYPIESNSMSDAIIIGAGPGGLFTGALLAKEGVKVTVIEKNATVGGGLQSFTRFGETFDTGMHIIGGMQKGGNVRRVCEYLGICDRLHITDIDTEIIDTVYYAEDRKMYCIAQGRERFVEKLAEQFPKQKENLKAYVDAVYGIVDKLDLYYLRPASDYISMHADEFLMPADGFIAKYISDKHLCSVLAYLNPLYSGRSNMTPAYVHALISVFYIDGPSRFAGGSQLFAETLRDFITEHGGQVIVGDGVEHISTQDKLITGVTTRKGKFLTADHYICAIHPCTFLKLLDNPAVLPKAYRNRLEEIPNSYSAFTLNLKLKRDSFRYISHTSYYISRYDEIWDLGCKDKEWPVGFLYLTPPEIEQGEYSTKMIIIAPMIWDEVRKWEDTRVGHRGKEYEKWKEECAEKLLDRMEELYPGFRDCLEDFNTASPLTIRDYYGVKEGGMYGYVKDCNNISLSQIPVVTKVKNLLFTGQNCNLHGFCGVLLTAINTCEAILGRNYILDRINRSENN